MTELIFEKSRKGRAAFAQYPQFSSDTGLPDKFLRHSNPVLPEVSELQVVRHFTRLSQKNFSIDTHFYPLGSCTMKYNPRVCNQIAMMPGFADKHPLSFEDHSQGFLSSMYELQDMLKAITGIIAI